MVLIQRAKRTIRKLGGKNSMGVFDYLDCTCTECGEHLSIQTKLLSDNLRDLAHYSKGDTFPCGRNGLIILKERCSSCHFPIGMLIYNNTIVDFFTITSLMVEGSDGSIDSLQ